MKVAIINDCVAVGPADSAAALEAFVEANFPGSKLRIIPIFPGFAKEAATPVAASAPEWLDRTPGSFLIADELAPLRSLIRDHLQKNPKSIRGLTKAMHPTAPSKFLNDSNRGSRVAIGRKAWEWAVSEGLAQDFAIITVNPEPENHSEDGVHAAVERAHLLGINTHQFSDQTGIPQPDAVRIFAGDRVPQHDAALDVWMSRSIIPLGNGEFEIL